MSDGMPNDAGWEKAAVRTAEAEAGKKAKVYAIGVGAGANLETLARFATAAQPLQLRDGMFREMFAWLSNSLATRSISTPIPDPSGEGATAVTAAGEEIKLPPIGWGTAD